MRDAQRILLAQGHDALPGPSRAELASSMAGKRTSCAHQVSVAGLGGEDFLLTSAGSQVMYCIEGRAPLH